MSMIIKGIRLRSSSGIGRTINHLENGDENDFVAFVSGTPADIRDMHRDAVSAGSKYAVRHWIVAPHESTTREQLAEVVENLAKEFAFDSARAAVVEHRKKRATTDAADIHWHVLVGEVDPATGRILATSFDRIKHELIARISEFSFGHAFVPGKHSGAVVKGLRKRDLHCIADRLEQFLDPSAAVSAEAFTHAKHQETKRLGLDLPALKQAIKLAVENARTREDIAKELAATGLEVKAGDKPGIWIVVNTIDGVVLGALHRLAGLPKSAINILMDKIAPSEAQENENAVRAVSPLRDLPQHESPPAAAEATSASAIAERVAKRLADMERSAVLELERAIPDFEPTAAMRQAKETRQMAAADLSRVVMQRSDIQLQIANVAPIRWWSRFTGSAGRRRREIVGLEIALEDIEADVRRKEMAITVCRRREVREEKTAKEIHLATVTDIAQRQKNARAVSAILKQAKIILEEKPDVAAKGLDFVLSMAKARLRRSEVIAHQLLEIEADRKINRK